MSLHTIAGLCLALACASAPVFAAADDFDTSAGNLIAVLRESPGTNHAAETLQPIGKVKATLSDGREVEIDASWFHYLGDMHVRLVFDGESSMQTASPDDLQRLRLSPEEAMTRAANNLRRRYGAPQAQPWTGGLMQVVGGAPDLVSSYFLDRAFWTELSRDYPEGVVVSVPKRTGLVFARADDELAVASLQFTAAALYASSDRNRISSALYLFKDGRWSVYQAPQPPAHAKAL
jgi:hypothetical protein